MASARDLTALPGFDSSKAVAHGTVNHVDTDPAHSPKKQSVSDLFTIAFQPIKNRLGNKWTFIIAAICGVVGILVTFFFVPDLTGEDLRVRDEKFRAYLVSKGWDGDMGEDDLKAAADQVMARGVPNGDGISANQTVKG